MIRSADIILIVHVHKHAIDTICLNRLLEIYLHGLHRRTTLRPKWWYVQLKHSRVLLDLISGQRFTPSGTRKNTMIHDFRHTKALMSSNWRAYNFWAKSKQNVKENLLAKETESWRVYGCFLDSPANIRCFILYVWAPNDSLLWSEPPT